MVMVPNTAILVVLLNFTLSSICHQIMFSMANDSYEKYSQNKLTSRELFKLLSMRKSTKETASPLKRIFRDAIQQYVPNSPLSLRTFETEILSINDDYRYPLTSEEEESVFWLTFPMVQETRQTNGNVQVIEKKYLNIIFVLWAMN